MKVLMINGSPHAKGNTYIALHEMEKIFQKEGGRQRSFRSEINRSAAVSPAIHVLKREDVYSTMQSMRRRRNLKSATVWSWQALCIMHLRTQP